MELRVTGVPGSHGFSINVGESECNIALHINPRFQGSGPGVVDLNDRKDGTWGVKVTDGNFPFRQGEEFEASSQQRPHPMDSQELGSLGKLNPPLGKDLTVQFGANRASSPSH
ncbi:hypothetical protein COCON_G00138090 [Conger conger]|uniref:Galectin n=1 Tax=Conger conger TaxID=82655 RepID=A0A9Q1DF67_CONCO|nr:hypothetical protein COCON_G00138090 [Conger conger]